MGDIYDNQESIQKLNHFEKDVRKIREEINNNLREILKIEKEIIFNYKLIETINKKKRVEEKRVSRRQPTFFKEVKKYFINKLF